MERRAYATFVKQWHAPFESLMVTSGGETFFDYLDEDFTVDVVLSALLDDFVRVRDYPAQGFQIEQTIPDDVTLAYQVLSQFEW